MRILDSEKKFQDATFLAREAQKFAQSQEEMLVEKVALAVVAMCVATVYHRKKSAKEEHRGGNKANTVKKSVPSNVCLPRVGWV